MVKGLKLSENDRETARAIMRFHAAKLGEQQAEGGQTKKARAFLKPLRERRATHVQPEELEVEFSSEGPVSFHSWLAEKPETERLRDIRKSKRIVTGLRGWPLDWLKTTGVVCYERAAGRVRTERDGAPDAAFLKGVVKTTELPTAVAEDSDHYVVVGPGGRWLRFMSVRLSLGVSCSGSPSMLATPQLTQLYVLLRSCCCRTPVRVTVSPSVSRALRLP